MTDYISRADAIEAVMAEGRKVYTSEYANAERIVYEADAVEALSMLPSADAEPKWNCTSNFVAEQLDRLRKMTDEEKWEFFKKFFEIKGGDDE